MSQKQKLVAVGQIVFLLAGVTLVAACENDSSKEGEVEEVPNVPDAGPEEDAGPAEEEPPEPLAPEPPVKRALVATTDYAETEVFLHNLTDKVVEGEPVKFADGDVSLVRSDRLAFAVERTHDVVHVFEDGKLRMFAETQGTGIALGAAMESHGKSLNPQAVVVVPGQDRAWVSLYNQAALVEIDLAQGSVASTLDLSEFHDLSDSDSSPEAAGGVYDPETKLVYFVLQRIDLGSFPIACTARRSLLIALDPATQKVVDLNGAEEEGKAVVLRLTNPTSLSLEADKGRLMILASGCTNTDTQERAEQGIETFELATRKTKLLYEAAASEYHTSLERVSDGEYLLSGYDAAWASVHALWNEAENKLGATLSNVPSGAVAIGDGLVLGVRSPEDAQISGYEVVSYAPSSQSSSLLVSNPKAAAFSGVSGIVELP